MQKQYKVIMLVLSQNNILAHNLSNIQILKIFKLLVQFNILIPKMLNLLNLFNMSMHIILNLLNQFHML